MDKENMHNFVRIFNKKTKRQFFDKELPFLELFRYLCDRVPDAMRSCRLKIVVLAKQVPDTRNVGPDAMTPAP